MSEHSNSENDSFKFRLRTKMNYLQEFSQVLNSSSVYPEFQGESHCEGLEDQQQPQKEHRK